MLDPERWREADRIFAAALDLPPGERPAFLEAACGRDPALRPEVERLLAADAAGAGFLEGTPGEMLGLAFGDIGGIGGIGDIGDIAGIGEPGGGGSLGPYRLLRTLGSGGMGTVYLARREDEHYQRDVAVKVLRSGLASTEAFHRFLAERQILAQLEHPNIARLYDGGSTPDGRPYLVLERVEGLPVDEYCDRHRLTVEQRLDLFQKICAAVQHAHQNLLVHRDLKPANILVTPEGEPKLLDFGIAKRLAPEPDAGAGDLQQTREGLRLLTPRYASPEQVRGEAITTASDVYSLGVILYELLAGRSPHPLTGELPYEVERAICEREPERPSAALYRPEAPPAEEIARDRGTRPSALGRRLQGDLDNIVLTAMRQEPGRRYGSAAQLAQDLERHLQNRPVTARPDTLTYRARKFARRNRAAVGLAAAVALLVAAFVASLLAQGRQLAQERDKARYALSFLVDTFKQADPYQTKGERLTAREILDQGADRISRELSGEPDVQAAVLDAIGEANLGLGRYGEAEPLLQRALALRREVFGPRSPEVAESLEHLAALENESAASAAAEAHLRAALAIRRRQQGGGGLATARTLNRLGRVLANQGVSPEAAPGIEALHREALAIARRDEGPEGLTAAETLLELANLQRAQGNYPEAERLFVEGLDIERKALGERAPRLWRDEGDLGILLFEAGKLKEAEARHRRCLEMQRRLLGADHPDVMVTVNNLAMALRHQGRYAEAEPLHREALSLARRIYGNEHWQVAVLLGNLASTVHAQDREREALHYYEESLAIRRRTLGEEDPLVAQNLSLIAELYRDMGEYPKALRLAEQALAIVEKAEGPDHPHVAYVLREIGRNYLQQGRFEEAEPVLRRCLEIRRRRLDPRNPDVGKAQVSYSQCLIALGRQEEAIPLLREARLTMANVYGPGHEVTKKAETLLAEAEGRQ